MGWTYTHKHSSLSIKEFFKEEFGFANDRRAVRLLDCAVVNLREAYLAFEDVDKATDKREVFAIVCLLDYRPNDHYNLGYKDMEESEGPCYYNCPERILKLLTPTTNEYAVKWREKCWERIKQRKARPKLCKGDVVEFSQPITFSSGVKLRTLRVLNPRRLIFEDAKSRGYTTYKLRRSTLEEIPFEVVGHAA